VENIEQVRNILVGALGDKKELSTYKCQMWQNNMSEGMTIHRYYQNAKAIMQKVKSLSKQNELYNSNWEAISTFIEEDALAAFIAGLKKP